MRVRVVFNLKNKGAVLPFHHQSLLCLFLNRHINKYYTGPNRALCHFSGIKGQTKLVSSGLSYSSSKITVVVSCVDDDLINSLIKSLFEERDSEIGQLKLSLDEVYEEMVNEYKSEAKYVTISPIMIRSSSENPLDAKRFISPESPEFMVCLKSSIRLRMESSGLYSREVLSKIEDLEFIPDAAYLHKMKYMDKKYARVYTIKKEKSLIDMRGYSLPFTLKADPEIHKFLFYCGFGSYCEYGYGMIDSPDDQFMSRIRPMHIFENQENSLIETN